MVWIYFSVPASFYRQGLTLVSRCFQLTGAWPPAAETPHTGVRPWKQGHRLTEKEMRSIDLPVHLCDPTRARAGHRIDAVPAWYPREVLRGERPKRVLVSFARSKETPSGERPHQAGKPEPGRLDDQSLRLVGADCVSLASPLRDGASLAHAVAPPLPTKPACAGLWRGPHQAGPPPFAQGRR